MRTLLIALLAVAPAALAQSAKDVNVVNTPTVKVANLPANQQVTVTNLPANQQVTVTNLPATQQVTVTNAPSVSVIGTVTTQTASPQPFQIEVHITIPAGQVNGSTSFTVPAGKRLVIEYVSIHSNASGGSASVETNANGNPVPHALNVVPNSFGFSVSQLMRLYADSGTQVYCGMSAVGAQQRDANCSVSGYLIDP